MRLHITRSARSRVVSSAPAGKGHTRCLGLRSLAEAIDTTTTAGGKLIFHIFAALAEFERGVIGERTLAGLQAARARGRTGGRPAAVSDRADSKPPTLPKGSRPSPRIR